MEKLDYRRINVIRNKLNYVDLKLDDTKGYTKEITDSILKNVNPKTLLADLKVDLNLVPVVKDRKDIFVEMEELFLKKKWYGFYALALPQIEGIFSEMVEIIEKKQSFSALPDKVG